MLSLIPQSTIDQLQLEHPDIYIDKEELEFSKVHTCPRVKVNIPEVFLAAIFPLMYGVDLNKVKFRDGDKYNWDVDNFYYNETADDW
jgi:hypothetical protein